MQRLAYWLIPLIASGVVIFIVIFVIQINSDLKIEKFSDNNQINLVTKIQKETSSIWVDTLSKQEKLGYSYPVNEIYLDIDLSNNIVDVKTYKLTALLKDPYQLFCIKQELKSLNLHYNLKKDKHNIEFLIVSKKMSQLKTLVKSLKNYQINANVQLYKKESK